MIKNFENKSARPVAGLAAPHKSIAEKPEEASLIAAFGVSLISPDSAAPSGATLAFCHTIGILRLPLSAQVAGIYGIMSTPSIDSGFSPDFWAVKPSASCSKKDRQKALHLPLTMAEMKTN